MDDMSEAARQDIYGRKKVQRHGTHTHTQTQTQTQTHRHTHTHTHTKYIFIRIIHLKSQHSHSTLNTPDLFSFSLEYTTHTVHTVHTSFPGAGNRL